MINKLLNKQNFLGFSIMSLMMVTNGQAGVGDVPHVFVPNTPALAEEVNENFSFLRTEAAINSDKIQSLYTIVDRLSREITDNEVLIIANQNLIATLQSDLSDANATIGVMANQIQANEETIDSLTTQLGEVNTRSVANENGLSLLGTEFNNLANDFLQLETDVDDLAQQLLSLAANEIFEFTSHMNLTDIGGQPFIEFTGVNVMVNDGSGSTDGVQNGLGNLIIGYNETSPDALSFCSDFRYITEAECLANGGQYQNNVRNGSHNLVVGQKNSYNATGSVIIGTNNVSNGDWGLVSGRSNQSLVDLGTVVGGEKNITHGFLGTVIGGTSNTIQSIYSTIAGGSNNLAQGKTSAIFGGSNNHTTHDVSTIGGGFEQQSDQVWGWVDPAISETDPAVITQIQNDLTLLRNEYETEVVNINAEITDVGDDISQIYNTLQSLQNFIDAINVSLVDIENDITTINDDVFQNVANIGRNANLIDTVILSMHEIGNNLSTLSDDVLQNANDIAVNGALIGDIQNNSVLELDGLLKLDTTQSVPAAVFESVNLQLVNGSNNTSSPNGTGNLIVGYHNNSVSGLNICSDPEYNNEVECIGAGEQWGINLRTGSHNVILGHGHSYIGTGSILVGKSNTAWKNSIVGGVSNHSVANYSHILTGGGNVIENSAINSVILSGTQNKISNAVSVAIVSGESNEISGLSRNSAIISGELNIVNGDHSFIGSGYANEILGDYSAIASGSFNLVSADALLSFIGSAEESEIFSGTNNFIATGFKNLLNGETNILLGGRHNKIKSNVESTSFSVIIGGFNNLIDSLTDDGTVDSVIVGGIKNEILGNRSVISAGSDRTIGSQEIDLWIAGDLLERE